jgi:hypothetical protein
VSEPPEDEQDRDCEDVGFALVNVRDILCNRKDVVEEDIDSKFYFFISCRLFFYKIVTY